MEPQVWLRKVFDELLALAPMAEGDPDDAWRAVVLIARLLESPSGPTPPAEVLRRLPALMERAGLPEPEPLLERLSTELKKDDDPAGALLDVLLDIMMRWAHCRFTAMRPPRGLCAGARRSSSRAQPRAYACWMTLPRFAVQPCVPARRWRRSGAPSPRLPRPSPRKPRRELTGRTAHPRLDVGPTWCFRYLGKPFVPRPGPVQAR